LAGIAFINGFGSQSLALKGYSGGDLFFEAVYSGKTLANFGITSLGLVGTWTLLPANGSDPYTANDTIQLIAGAPTPPSVPALGGAFLWPPWAEIPAFASSLRSSP
jgi:hypothetical protein